MADSKKVLLVDDSPTILMVARTLLEGASYAILSASDGQQGVETALTELPDLILMDVVMPGMDGFEACRRLRAMPPTREIPIILMTTRSSPEHVERGYESGCNDYIIKPFDGDELRAKVQNLLGT
jgi:CheY-like chemotaxis protein